MHDQHAIQALIDRLTAAGLEEVTEVRIQAAAIFSPEALQQAYEMLTQDTPLAGSQLVVTEWEHECACPACGHSWKVERDDVEGHVVVCPSCGAICPFESGAGIEVIGIS